MFIPWIVDSELGLIQFPDEDFTSKIQAEIWLRQLVKELREDGAVIERQGVVLTI